MDSQGQFRCFCLCLCVGFVGGIVYEFFSVVRTLLGCRRGKNRIIEICLDVVFFCIFAFICIYAAYVLRFSAFRVYTWIGYALGITIYLKTLHRILAFLENIFYNKLIKVIKKARKTKKLSKVREGKL